VPGKYISYEISCHQDVFGVALVLSWKQSQELP